MSAEQPKGRSVQAQVLKKVRVLNTSKPDVAVIELSVGNNVQHVLLPRAELDRIGDLLKKNAADPKAADGTAPNDVA